MAGRLNINSRFGIVIVSGIAISIVLFLLPKTVVSEKGSQSQSAGEKQSSAKETHPAFELTAEQNKQLKELRSSSAPEGDKLKLISEFFLGINAFDSSAIYAERYAEIKGDISGWLDAGDKFYQAFSLSLNPVEKEKLAEKTREVYNKALAINPNDLHAKTNMAMTYVSSSSPMQGIMMLRQVLDVNPKYVPAIMSMGALSMQSGQYDRAVARFQDVLKIDPANINARIGLAYSFIELGKKEEARSLLNEVISEDIDEVLKTEVTRTLESLK